MTCHVFAVTLVGNVFGINILVDFGSLKASVWNLDEVEEFVERLVLYVLDVALELGLDVLENWLNRVAIGITHRTFHRDVEALFARHLLTIHECETFDMTTSAFKDIC